MGVGYCIRCKSKVELKDGQLGFYKNGVPVERGKCIKCGCNIARILTTAERAELKAKQQPGEQPHE